MTNLRLQIAEELLGCALDGIYGPCPGASLHTKRSGKRDFRVVLDGAPTGFCFHASCGDAIDAFNKELRRRIWFAENGRSPAPTGHWADGVAPEPKAEPRSRPLVDTAQVEEMSRGVPSITPQWLAERSPVSVEGLSSGEFLSHLYKPDERILIFTTQYSQGDFVWWMGRGGFRLSQTRGVQARPSALPPGTPSGIWYLVQPVTAQWGINSSTAKFGEEAKWTRRSEGNVTAWRYFVLESDTLEPALWLKIVVNLPIPISAIYTSGGRSIHALARWESSSKAEWDATRNILRQIVCPLGADPAALTAVRLSRLPGCKRAGREQKLLYLNPTPGHDPIRLLPSIR